MERSRLTVTAEARQKVESVRQFGGEPDDALRIAIRGWSDGHFEYELGLVGVASIQPGDVVIDLGDLTAVIDGASATRIYGTTIAFEPSPFGGSLKIENPNEGWADNPLAARVQAVIDTQINPGVAGHGGHVSLLDVRDGAAYIQLGGGCQGCGMVDVTLKQGIEVSIRGAVPEITQVVDTTDHAAGTNPFHQPAKK